MFSLRGPTLKKKVEQGRKIRLMYIWLVNVKEGHLTTRIRKRNSESLEVKEIVWCVWQYYGLLQGKAWLWPKWPFSQRRDCHNYSNIVLTAAVIENLGTFIIFIHYDNKKSRNCKGVRFFLQLLRLIEQGWIHNVYYLAVMYILQTEWSQVGCDR